MLLTDEIKKIATELVSRDGVMIFSLPYSCLCNEEVVLAALNSKAGRNGKVFIDPTKTPIDFSKPLPSGKLISTSQHITTKKLEEYLEFLAQKHKSNSPVSSKISYKQVRSLLKKTNGKKEINTGCCFGIEMARQHFKGEKRFKALAMIDISSEDKLNNDSDFNQLKKDPYFQSALSGYKNKKEFVDDTAYNIIHHQINDSSSSLNEVMPSNSRYVFTGYFSTDQLTKLLSINKNNLTKKIWLVIHQPEHTISIKYKQKLLFYNSNFHMPHKYLAVKHLSKDIINTLGNSLSLEYLFPMDEAKTAEQLFSNVIKEYNAMFIQTTLDLFKHGGASLLYLYSPEQIKKLCDTLEKDSEFQQNIANTLSIKDKNGDTTLFNIVLFDTEFFKKLLAATEKNIELQKSIIQALQVEDNEGYTTLSNITLSSDAFKALLNSAIKDNGTFGKDFVHILLTDKNYSKIISIIIKQIDNDLVEKLLSKMKQNEINGKDKGDLTELSLFKSTPLQNKNSNEIAIGYTKK